MMAEEGNDLPIDRLREGTMTDREAVSVAAEIVRMSRIHEHGQDVFVLLAERLDQVKLREEGK